MRLLLRALPAVAALFAVVDAAPGQLDRPPGAPVGGPTARIETATLEITQPDDFLVSLVLEPARSVSIRATEDGIVQSIPGKVGDVIREHQEIAQMDRSEAQARLAIAQAELQERSAAPASPVTQAQVAAAKARVDLAQIAVDRCTLRAPFSGVIHRVSVSPGQYVAKGDTIAELADVASLRALLPVDRNAVQNGGTIRLEVEGREVEGSVSALVPLPERFDVLRRLATPWAGAWVEFTGPSAQELQPGQRVMVPFIPTAPIAVVPAQAIRGEGGSIVQLIRNEHVASVPVRVLGSLGPERVQVAGGFRPNDAVIVEASVALADGTFIRFQSGAGASSTLQTLPPDPGAAGEIAEVGGASVPTQPRATGVAPIGAPGSAVPKSAARPAGNAPANNPPRNTRPAGTPPGSVPF